MYVRVLCRVCMCVGAGRTGGGGLMYVSCGGRAFMGSVRARSLVYHPFSSKQQPLQTQPSPPPKQTNDRPATGGPPWPPRCSRSGRCSSPTSKSSGGPRRRRSCGCCGSCRAQWTLWPLCRPRIRRVRSVCMGSGWFGRELGLFPSYRNRIGHDEKPSLGTPHNHSPPKPIFKKQTPAKPSIKIDGQPPLCSPPPTTAH